MFKIKKHKMDKVIENVSLRDFSENRLNILLNNVENAFKVVVLNINDDCRALFITLCWPKDRIATTLSNFSFKGLSSPISLWNDALSADDEFWKNLFKLVNRFCGQLLKNIPCSIFGDGLSYGFEHYPFASKFSSRLNDYKFKSYAIPNNPKSLNKFLYWLDISWSEFGDYFAWPTEKISCPNSKEANYYENLFLKTPSTKWDNNKGMPIIQEAVKDIDKQIEKFLKQEVCKFEHDKVISILPCLEQIAGDPYRLPLWSFPPQKELFPLIDVKPVIRARGEAAYVWAEICALRARLINHLMSPLFFAMAENSLKSLKEIVEVSNIVDMDKLTINPIEEIDCYVGKILNKYPSLDRSLMNNIYK